MSLGTRWCQSCAAHKPVVGGKTVVVAGNKASNKRLSWRCADCIGNRRTMEKLKKEEAKNEQT